MTVIIDSVRLDAITAAAKHNPHRRIIADGVEYGIYVELGTTRMIARPFLVPNFERVTKKLPKAIGAAVQNAIPLQFIVDKAAFDVMAGAMVDAPVDTGALMNSLHVE